MKYRISGVLHMVVSLFVLSAAAAVFIFAYRSYLRADQKIIQFDAQTVGAVYIGVNDLYGMENTPVLSDFFAEPDALERMAEFHEFLENNYNYIVFQMQPLLTQGEMPYQDECRIDYGQAYFGENDQFGYSLSAVQLNQNAYQMWEISNMMDTGSGFAQEDFVQESPKNVPAILGDTYKELVSVGDTYPIDYYGETITLQITGFFQKDAMLPFLNGISYLDNCIVIPSYQIKYPASSEEEKYMQKILLSQQNWGYIRMQNGENYYDYQKEIEAKSQELNLLYRTNEAYASAYIQEVSGTLNSTKGAFLLVAVLLFLILSMLILYIFIWDYNKNRLDYAIHLACGASLTQIKTKIFCKVCFLFIAAFLCAAGINARMLGYERLNREAVSLLSRAVSFSAALIFCVVLLTCAALNFYINKNNVYTTIQEDLD